MIDDSTSSRRPDEGGPRDTAAGPPGSPGRSVGSEEATTSEDELRDLGFGSRVAGESKLRLLNRDGTFNVARHGLPRFRSATV